MKNVQNVPFNPHVAKLQTAIAGARVCVFDWEDHDGEPVSVGVYLPESNRAFYINVGHTVWSSGIPKTPVSAVVEALDPFFFDPSRLAIGHNILYDAIINQRIGIKQRCRMTDAMLLQHRLNENFSKIVDDPSQMSSFNGEPGGIGYGLKPLTNVHFGIKPITFQEITKGLGSIALVNPEKAAGYCVNDCLNTWNLYTHATEALKKADYPTALLDLDDENLSAVLRMLSNGIPTDLAEVEFQIKALTENEEACTAEIYRMLGQRQDIESKFGQTKALRDFRCLPPDPEDRRQELRAQIVLAEDNSERKWLYNVMKKLPHKGPLARESLIEQIPKSTPTQQAFLAAFIARNVARQRLSRFLKPIPAEHVNKADSRIYLNSFLSLTASTRFSCKPNFQSLPKRAERPGINKLWIDALPNHLQLSVKTRKVIAATAGHVLISADLSTAEPRYVAVKMEQSLHDKGRAIRIRDRDRWSNAEARYADLFEWSKKRKKRQTEPREAIDYSKITDIKHEQLWTGFQEGSDPYDTIASRVGVIRDIAKQLWLSVVYGIGPETLAANISKIPGSTIQTTSQADDLIKKLYKSFPMMEIIQEETRRELLAFGMVKTLWGRPRRIQGFYQLAEGDECDIVFRHSRNKYRARIIPLGLLQWGVHCFVKTCWRLDPFVEDGEYPVTIQADRATKTYQVDPNDPFVNADHFALPPFRNPSYSLILTVTKNGITYPMPLVERAFRQAFNGIFQGTGADHMRVIMNEVDTLLQEPRFQRVKMILTIHDELLFECPNEVPLVVLFINCLRKIITTRPAWATVPIKTEVTVGLNYGDMRNLDSLLRKPYII